MGQAALVAGVGLLIVTITAPFAQFYVFPTLLAPGDVDQTAQNLAESRGLFLAGIMAYLVNDTFDIVVAWALYKQLIRAEDVFDEVDQGVRLLVDEGAVFLGSQIGLRRHGWEGALRHRH